MYVQLCLTFLVVLALQSIERSKLELLLSLSLCSRTWKVGIFCKFEVFLGPGIAVRCHEILFWMPFALVAVLLSIIFPGSHYHLLSYFIFSRILFSKG